MIIAVASGKGGTGKTTIAVNLALALNEGTIADCDVEEPNVHIFLHPTITTTEDVTVFIPNIEQTKCTSCGVCVEVCEFNALAMIKDRLLFFPDLCMNCEACMELCPDMAISSGEKKIGLINSGFVNTNLQFINGELDIGSPRAIPIIQKIKESISSDQIVIFDAPPGNSCPVIETISGSDFCILVTEPTAFGLWDVRIAVKVVRELNIPFGIIINRTGISDQEQFLDDFCKEENIPILMKIPFEKKIAEDYSRGIPLVNSPVWKEKFLHLFNSCKELVNQ